MYCVCIYIYKLKCIHFVIFFLLNLGNNGKYWHANPDNSISVDAEFSQGFYIELREPSKLCIKTKDGNYIVADKNGLFKVGGSDPKTATTWEY